MYKNRYGDTVEFIPVNDNTIEFKVTQENGVPSEYWRFAWETDEQKEKGEYTMADPSGGPYISKGHNMGIENKQFEGKVVKYITSENNKILIHT